MITFYTYSFSIWNCKWLKCILQKICPRNERLIAMSPSDLFHLSFLTDFNLDITYTWTLALGVRSAEVLMHRTGTLALWVLPSLKGQSLKERCI